MFWLVYTILLAISGGVGFVLTNILYKEDPEKEDPEGKELDSLDEQSAAAPSIPDATVLTTEKGTVTAPVAGTVIAASRIPDPMFAIPDPMFAQETMGPSIGIEPTDGVVYAPFDGTVLMVFPTNHAVGLRSDSGMEVLIHVGVDTVNMNGDGFESFVKQDDVVKKGARRSRRLAIRIRSS